VLKHVVCSASSLSDCYKSMNMAELLTTFKTTDSPDQGLVMVSFSIYRGLRATVGVVRRCKLVDCTD